MEEEGRCGNWKEIRGIRREDRKRSFGCLAIIFVIGLIIGLTGNIRKNCQTPNHNSTEPKHNITLSAIYQLLLTQFWWNCKGRLLETSRTDSDCHDDICPGNIYPYQDNLSCYSPDFDDFKSRFQGTSFVQATFVQVKFAHNSTSAISQLLLTRFWWNFKRRFLWASRTV